VVEQLEHAPLDLLAHDVLPPAGLVVHVGPVESDHVGEQALGEAVLAQHVHGLAAAVGGQFEVAVALHDDEAVALHAADGLRHRGAGVTESLGDARPQGHDVLLLEVQDGAEVHLGGVDQVRHRCPPASRLVAGEGPSLPAHPHPPASLGLGHAERDDSQ
jgi:hypothetical protein